MTSALPSAHYVLFFIKIGSRDVHIAGVAPHPNEAWMKQIARNITLDEWGFLHGQRFLIHDRDSKFSEAFQGDSEDGRCGSQSSCLRGRQT